MDALGRQACEKHIQNAFNILHVFVRGVVDEEQYKHQEHIKTQEETNKSILGTKPPERSQESVSRHEHEKQKQQQNNNRNITI